MIKHKKPLDPWKTVESAIPNTVKINPRRTPINIILQDFSTRYCSKTSAVILPCCNRTSYVDISLFKIIAPQAVPRIPFITVTAPIERVAVPLEIS